MDPSRSTTVSAPGKVLLAGGYLVLDPQYSGLVVATASRFYCNITGRPGSSSAPSCTDPARISVRAGQFPTETSTWTYDVSMSADGTLLIHQINEEVGRNKFVEITLTTALQVVWESLSGETRGQSTIDSRDEMMRRIRGSGEGLDVVVLADNDFYSQREQLAAASLSSTLASLETLARFHPLPRPIHKTNKTGLGSSAALVTSLTAALLTHLGVIDLLSTSQSQALHHADDTRGDSRSPDLDLVHSLAQLSHCIAQGKVGSGFDVSAAVYGTHAYRRFSPSILTPLMSSMTTPLHTLLPALRGDKWDNSILPFRLPRGLRLLLADVDAGTDTPLFVGTVLAWRERMRMTADEIWGDLSKANDTLGELLRDLAGRDREGGYEGVLFEAAESVIDQLSRVDMGSPILQLVVRIRAALTLIRSILQHMSTLSFIPIEPPEQTRLLDACSSLPGVLGGGVPGAGGYDAIFLLVIDQPSVIDSVEQLWSSWDEMSVCPLSAKQSDGGLRKEDVGEIPGLREALVRR